MKNKILWFLYPYVMAFAGFLDKINILKILNIIVNIALVISFVILGFVIGNKYSNTNYYNYGYNKAVDTMCKMLDKESRLDKIAESKNNRHIMKVVFSDTEVFYMSRKN